MVVTHTAKMNLAIGSQCLSSIGGGIGRDSSVSEGVGSDGGVDGGRYIFCEALATLIPTASLFYTITTDNNIRLLKISIELTASPHQPQDSSKTGMHQV